MSNTYIKWVIGSLLVVGVLAATYYVVSITQLEVWGTAASASFGH